MSEERATGSAPGSRLRKLYDVVLAANVAAAVAYACFLHIVWGMEWGEPTGDFPLYYLWRAQVRINDALHVTTVNAVRTEVGARFPEAFPRLIGQELAFLIPTIALACLLLLLWRLSARVASGRTLIVVRGFFALFAFPLAYLITRHHDWPLPNLDETPAPSFWRSLPFVVFGTELVIALILLVWLRSRFAPTSPPKVLVAILATLHGGFWLLVLWSETGLTGMPRVFLFRYAFLATFILAISTWADLAAWPEPPQRSGSLWWPAAALLLAAVVVVLTLLPAHGDSIAHPRDLSSVTIKLERGSCMGSCPVYSVIIHGTGAVEFNGVRYTRVYGPASATISRDQVIQILATLDRASFWSLEDRAFYWCFDTPSVRVTLSIDGQSKSVTSDAGCDGKNGSQARFVKATDEIDRIARTEQWLCQDNACVMQAYQRERERYRSQHPEATVPQK